VERIGAIAQREMVAAFLEVFPDAPTLNLVDPKVGPTWGDLEALPAWLHHVKEDPAIAYRPEELAAECCVGKGAYRDAVGQILNPT
jgi:hypothetical protein